MPNASARQLATHAAMRRENDVDGYVLIDQHRAVCDCEHTLFHSVDSVSGPGKKEELAASPEHKRAGVMTGYTRR